MLSVYSTEKLKSNVFECSDCLYRFTHRQRHLDKFPNHGIKKITAEEIGVYPKQVIDYLRFKCVLSAQGSEVLNQYAEYCRDKLKKPLANFQFDAISRIFRGTHSLKRTDLLDDCITKLNEEKNTPSVQPVNSVSTLNSSLPGWEVAIKSPIKSQNKR